MKSVSYVEILISLNKFHHNTVNISIICKKLIALFVAVIYNIYSIYSKKDILNGLYYSERISRKTYNYSILGTSPLRTGQNIECCLIWTYLGKYLKIILMLN